MRPRINITKWKVIRISIDIDEAVINCAKSVGISRDEFFDKTVELLQENGYIPVMSVDLMKKKFHSPFSESEYYTFIKLEDSVNIRIVLDIRMAEHQPPEYGNHSARDRHIFHMKNVTIPKVAKDLGANADDAEAEFIDVVDNDVFGTSIITIDDKVFKNYSDAFVYIKHRIQDLP